MMKTPLDDRDLVLREPAPDLLPVPASLDVADRAELAAGLERDLGGQTGAGRENFAFVLRLPSGGG